MECPTRVCQGYGKPYACLEVDKRNFGRDVSPTVQAKKSVLIWTNPNKMGLFRAVCKFGFPHVQGSTISTSCLVSICIYGAEVRTKLLVQHRNDQGIVFVLSMHERQRWGLSPGWRKIKLRLLINLSNINWAEIHLSLSHGKRLFGAPYVWTIHWNGVWGMFWEKPLLR